MPPWAVIQGKDIIPKSGGGKNVEVANGGAHGSLL